MGIAGESTKRVSAPGGVDPTGATREGNVITMVKNLFAIAFAAVMAVGIVGCACSSTSSSSASGSSAASSSAASSAASSSAASSSASAESSSAVSSASSASIGTPNPWSDVASAADAAQAAGLKSFSVPDAGVKLSVGELGDWTFQCMDGMAQAKNAAGDVGITIRKAVYAGDGDISGDYNTYEAEWPLTLKGLTVNCAGHSEDAANKVLWVRGDDAYCILADGAGLNPDDINSLINAIQ